MLIAWFGLAACTSDQAPPLVLRAIDAQDPVGISVVEGVGAGSVSLLVRAENRFGAAVPAGETTLAVTSDLGATLQSPDLAFDATGYAEAIVSGDTAHTFTVDVVSSTDTSENLGSAEGTLLNNPAPRFEVGTAAALPAAASEPAFVAQGTFGYALGAGDTVWWKPADVDGRPHPVATLPADIDGMVGGDIDADGVVDSAVWGGATALVLRGRDGGGYTWAAGWTVTDGRRITGMSIADLDADRLGDVALAVTNGVTSWIELVYTDGAWAFESREAMELEDEIVSVSALDEDADGRPDVTVLSGQTGHIERYLLAEAGWVQAGPSRLVEGANVPFQAPPGSRLLPSADLDLDRQPDVIINESPGAGSHNLTFFTLGSPITKIEQAYTAYHADVADLDQDGAADLLILEDDQLRLISYDEEIEDFVAEGVLGVGNSAPLVATQINDDLVLDLAVAGTFAKVYEGELVEDEDTAAIDYEIREWGWTAHGFGLAGPVVAVNFNASGNDDVVGFREAGTTLRVDGWRNDGGAGAVSFTRRAGFSFPNDFEAFDIERCGSRYFALAGTETQSELVRFTAGASGPSAAARVQTAGRLLSCNNRGPIAVIVASETGAWTGYGVGLGEINSGNLDPVSDVALQWTGEQQIILTCSAPGCDVIAIDLDGDGTDETATSNGQTITIEGWDQSWVFAGAGALSTGDIDNDGLLDIIATNDETGSIVVFRTVTEGIAPPVAWYTDREVQSTVVVGDFFGNDGRAEIGHRGADGNFLHSPGTIAAP